MKPAPFRYVRASRLDDALAELARYGDGAKVLAGGQSIWAEPRHEGAPIRVRMAPAHGQGLQHRARGADSCGSGSRGGRCPRRQMASRE